MRTTGFSAFRPLWEFKIYETKKIFADILPGLTVHERAGHQAPCRFLKRAWSGDTPSFGGGIGAGGRAALETGNPPYPGVTEQRDEVDKSCRCSPDYVNPTHHAVIINEDGLRLRQQSLQ